MIGSSRDGAAYIALAAPTRYEKTMAKCLITQGFLGDKQHLSNTSFTYGQTLMWGCWPRGWRLDGHADDRRKPKALIELHAAIEIGVTRVLVLLFATTVACSATTRELLPVRRLKPFEELVDRDAQRIGNHLHSI